MYIETGTCNKQHDLVDKGKHYTLVWMRNNVLYMIRKLIFWEFMTHEMRYSDSVLICLTTDM